MPADHKEIALEVAFEQSLLAHGGLLKGDTEAFARELVLDRSELLAFLHGSQPKTWAIPCGDSDLETLSSSVRFLIPRPPRRASGPQYHFDEKVELSTLIEMINERFGASFTAADELFFGQIREEADGSGRTDGGVPPAVLWGTSPAHRGTSAHRAREGARRCHS